MHCVSLFILASVLVSCQAQIWPETGRKFDIIFLLETAQPLSFLAMQNAMQSVAPHISMDSNVHLGVVSFGQGVEGTIMLTGSQAGFITAVEGLPTGGLPGHRIDLALQTANSLMGSAFGGRPDVDKVIICLLTGPSDFAPITTALAHNVRVAYIQIAALGIGADPALVLEMEEIASDASRMAKHNADIAQFNANYASQIAHIFQVAGICSKFKWNNSVHFVPDPANCNAFFQCSNVDNKIKQHCPLGQFWDGVALTCRPAADVQCKDDPCFYHFGLVNYGDALQRNCAYLWRCGSGARTDGYGCCPDAQTFQINPAFGLPGHVPSPYPFGSCVQLTDPCTDVCPIVYPTFAGVAAPQGSPSCYPEIYLDFNDNVQGHAQYKAYIENKGVTIANPITQAVDDYAGFFNGQADLISARFSNAWFGRYVEIFVRFMPDPAVTALGKTELLVANGGSGDQHTVFIGYNREQQEIIVKFNAVALASGVVPNVQGNWIEVRVLYDAAVRELTVDVTGFPAVGPSAVNPQLVLVISGHIKQALPALHIGGYTDASTNEYENFHGWIDTFWIYLCRPATYWS